MLTVEDTAIADRDEDFVQFVFEDVAQRRAAEDAFYADLSATLHKQTWSDSTA